MILPSLPMVPVVAVAATTLLTQIMLPAAPPMFCRATIRTGLMWTSVAVWNCRPANSVLETVLEPDMKAPSTPMKGAMTM